MFIRPRALLVGVSIALACGPVDPGDSDGGSGSSGGSTDGATSTGGAASTGDASSTSDGSSSTGSSSGTPTTGAGADECEYPGQTMPCEEGGVDGINVCYDVFYTAERRWSVCFTEPCEAGGAARPCAGGTQYCTYNYADAKDVLFWGACVAEPKCEPGEFMDCGSGPDMPATRACITDGNGEPDWDPLGCNI